METGWRADIEKPRLICRGQINQIKIISTKIGLYTRFNRGPHTIYGYNVISLCHKVFTSLSPCFLSFSSLSCSYAFVKHMYNSAEYRIN